MSSLDDQVICFTGTLQHYTRAQASKVAEEAGARVSKTVTKSVDIVVCGEGAGAKRQQAESKGCTVWTEEEFQNAVGGQEKKEPATAAASTPPRSKRKPPPAAYASTPKPTPAAAKKKKTSIAPATPALPGSRDRRVMSAISGGDSYSVHGDYDVKLMLSDQVSMNSNKFYKLQLLLKNDGGFYVATNWGRLGEPGKSQLKGPHSEDKGIQEFSKVFRSKTKNAWGAQPFVRHGDKYQLVETADDDGDGGGDQALGRLTESQIQKGQAVLQDIRRVIETKSSAKRPKKGDPSIGNLTNDFYSLIPTQSGRQRPPPLDNLDIVTEKEGLLEFWLRMGFDDMSNTGEDGSPIDGVLDLPVPPTLRAAASSIADSGSIKTSQSRGTELANAAAGNPDKAMSSELYAAILLYTGNSIYRELNRVLRTDWKSARKYWNYLRLYFAAMECMPKKPVTLWRGIAADLYDEYVPGKVITWWMVSSCTSSKQVAENFMNQLGSTATLLTLHTKNACDISPLSFYPHEQESLLSPGTKLKVLSRKRKGKVAEIEVEEVEE